MIIEDAIIFAAEKHRGQRDKLGRPYILHPLRVAMRLTDEREQLVAILHDLVEDTGVTADELRARDVEQEVVDAVLALSKRDGEAYSAFIERVARNAFARAVKLADIADNLDPARLGLLPAEEQEHLRTRYEAARSRLLEPRGPTQRRDEAGVITR